MIIRLLHPSGDIEELELEDYLRGVVAGEVPQSFARPAHEAQVVAARSVTLFWKREGRHKEQGADVCSDASHCQAYRPDKIGLRTDQAVARTRGVIATYQGEVIEALYSARCGGMTIPSEKIWSRKYVPYLRAVVCPDKGVMRGHGVGACQMGMELLARQGYGYEGIIRHYYSGVELATVPESFDKVLDEVPDEHKET